MEREGTLLKSFYESGLHSFKTHQEYVKKMENIPISLVNIDVRFSEKYLQTKLNNI
jgi:hypothetical protein